MAHEIDMVRCEVCSQRYCGSCVKVCPVCQSEHQSRKEQPGEDDAIPA